jgi:hypothetical protein
LPRIEGLMLERSEGTQHCRRMDEAIEPPELRVNRARDIAEIVGTGFGEIERKDRRLWMAGRNDFVVQRFEFSHDAAVQHERCAARRRNRVQARDPGRRSRR